VVWLLLAIPIGQPLDLFNQVAPSDSLFGALCRELAPAFAPAGFDRWEATGALSTGLAAKEVVGSTLSQIYVGASDSPAQAADEPAPTLLDDLGAIARELGHAALMTGQELVNIVPRTLNLIPVLHVPELNLLPEHTSLENDTALEAALRGAFTPLAAVAFNVFVLLYTPCMATGAAMRQEFGLRWTLFHAAYTLGVAWLAAVLVYQGGLLLGLG
jgi:ferrous iron transport protein B